MTQELQSAIKLVQGKCTPEEVYTPDQLIQWARDHMEPHHIYRLSELKSTIADLKAETI